MMILRMLRRKEKEQEKQKKVARKGWDEVEKNCWRGYEAR